jgi:osmotically-inducible protein OsmY
MPMLTIAVAVFSVWGAGPFVESLEDSAITAQIEGLFLANAHLNPFNINTTTVGGVVTLSGGVREEAQKTLATDLARTVQGVKEVKNQIVVVPTATGQKERRGWRQKAEDKGAAAAVRARLVGKGQFAGLKIGVACVNREITLYGVVHSESQKAHLGAIAEETQGVASVVNNLTVRPRNPGDPIQKAGQQISDEWLEGRVATAFLLNRYLKLRELDVEVDDGVCILSGTVDAEAERTLAEALTRSIRGVGEIRNDIKVSAGPTVKLEGSEPREGSDPAPALETKPLASP